jgi:hypothetical protein
MASAPAPASTAAESCSLSEDALLELIESLEPLPPAHSYVASDDNELMQTTTRQLLAILRSPPPYASQTTPLALVVSILIGRSRALAAPHLTQAAMEAFVTESALGEIFKLFPSLREDMAYNSVQIVPGTEKGNIQRRGGFRIGGGRFTTEQSAAVLGMWLRFSHAWPPSLSKEKAVFLLEIDPCLHRFLCLPGTVSVHCVPPVPPPARSLCSQFCRIHTQSLSLHHRSIPTFT